MTRLHILAVFALLSAGCADNNSTCEPVCGDFMECCDGICSQLGSDPANCGGCGITCGAGEACVGSMCQMGGFDAGCLSSQIQCGGRCLSGSVAIGSDGRSDESFQNCGGCGLTCDMVLASACSVPGGGTGRARCLCGDFDQCAAGSLCTNDMGTWVCTNTATDPMNCGAVGNLCAQGEACVSGACVCGGTGAACGVGSACCGGVCTDTTSDPAHCGGCGETCTPNAPDCEASACTCAASGRVCDAPVPGIGGGGDLGESCCPGMGCMVNSDTSCNCMPCSGGDECVVGGSGILPGGGAEAPNVCCGNPIFVALLGCGGFGFPGGDGGLPFPGLDGGLPGLDGGLPGLDGGLPGLDGGLPGLDGGLPLDGSLPIDAGL